MIFSQTDGPGKSYSRDANIYWESSQKISHLSQIRAEKLKCPP